MKPKLQKQSALKLGGRIIPRSGGFNTPQLTAEYVSKACFGVHTRDYKLKNFCRFNAFNKIDRVCLENRFVINFSLCPVPPDKASRRRDLLPERRNTA